MFLTFNGTNNSITTLKEMGIRLADNTIQYKSDDGSWNNIISTSGEDGREITLRTSDTHIEWSYKGTNEWTQLISLKELNGEIQNNSSSLKGGSIIDGNPKLSIVNGTLNITLPLMPKGGGNG